MASCKDCIHYEACKSQVPRTFWDSETFYHDCKYFKDRTRFVELPCKVGDTVFVVNGFKEIEEFEVDYYVVKKNVISVGMVDDGEYEIETVFLTREEAERALNNSEKSNS
ncbi:hypothetical protein [uncultured Ruminococcus sp.]|uniref:hypothetical protein n=1 Tax=uncultured Ruminococcus sp. TaxID=165186 RepID=UPI0025EB1DBB|nr:hypothetical protein [uncultured Ruminococcus sp.]